MAADPVAAGGGGGSGAPAAGAAAPATPCGWAQQAHGWACRAYPRVFFKPLTKAGTLTCPPRLSVINTDISTEAAAVARLGK